MPLLARLRPALLCLGVLAAACDRPADRPAPQGKAAGAPARSAPARSAPGKPVADNGRIDRAQAGLPAPDATFRDAEGEPVTLADYRGRPVLLNLWATWCAPCVAEMPTLDALAARETGRLSVITISEDSDDEGEPASAKVDAFFTRMKFASLGAYLDPESAVMTQLGVGVLPTTILYDGKGNEVWRMTGEIDWTGTRARQLLAEAG